MCRGFALDRLRGSALVHRGSIATSLAASRHRSDTVRRRPSSSTMRTSFRLRPSNARTRSRAVLALAGRSTTSVTPAPEVTLNFMPVPARHAPKGSPAPWSSTRGGVTALAGGQALARNLRLLYGHGQQDIKVEATKARRVALAPALSSRGAASGLSKRQSLPLAIIASAAARAAVPAERAPLVSSTAKLLKAVIPY
jgi:hypothetical protein